MAPENKLSDLSETDFALGDRVEFLFARRTCSGVVTAIYPNALVATTNDVPGKRVFFPPQRFRKI